MKPAADLLALAEDHALRSAKAQIQAVAAESRGAWEEATQFRATAHSLAATSQAFSQLATARALYVANDPFWPPALYAVPDPDIEPEPVL